MALKDDLMAASCVAWIIGNQFVTETRKPFEFFDHRFLLEYLADNHRHKVSKKASQIGETVGELFDDFHLAIHHKLNVIHTLHTSDVIKGFVRPKVNPLIQHNAEIKRYMTVDSEGLKQFRDNFVYFRGANSESQAISISADVLKIDEKDRSDPHVVEMFQSRLDFSEYKWIREFSNPSAIGYGVDETYSRSDQRHWFVKCHHCNHYMYMDFEREFTLGGSSSHYVDKQRKIFACGKCDRELSDADRCNGEWVAKYPSRDKIHGYWFSQMMAPWFTAEEILDKYENNSISYFYNFVLGKAWTPSDLIINRDTILRATAPSNIAKVQVAIGVDQNVNEQIWVAATPEGVFAHGRTKSWEDLERLKLTYNAVVVCDPMPYPTMPKILAEKYNDFYLCRFKQMDGLSVIDWKDQIVYADRTRLLDIVANEITEIKLLFRESPYALEDYIADWQNLYRTTIEKEDGRMVSTWLKKENKESDFSLATAYMRIALSRIIGGGSMLVEPRPLSSSKVTETINDGTLQSSLNESVEETFAQME